MMSWKAYNEGEKWFFHLVSFQEDSCSVNWRSKEQAQPILHNYHHPWIEPVTEKKRKNKTKGLKSDKNEGNEDQGVKERDEREKEEEKGGERLQSSEKSDLLTVLNKAFSDMKKDDERWVVFQICDFCSAALTNQMRVTVSRIRASTRYTLLTYDVKFLHNILLHIHIYFQNVIQVFTSALSICLCFVHSVEKKEETFTFLQLQI